MPRAFPDPDRVRRDILAAAREHFTRFGYRRAVLAEVARTAGVAKGSVYLFFPSKVELFVAMAEEVEAELQARIRREMRAAPPAPGERVRRLLQLQRELFADHPVLRVVNEPAEAAALFRDLPEETAARMLSADERFFTELVSDWEQPVEADLLVAVCRAAYALGLQREMIGAAAFPEFMELFVDAVAAELARRTEA